MSTDVSEESLRVAREAVGELSLPQEDVLPLIARVAAALDASWHQGFADCEMGQRLRKIGLWAGGEQA